MVVAGDRVRRERSIGIVFASLGICDFSPETGGYRPCREEKEEARCTVTIDEDDTEVGLEP